METEAWYEKLKRQCPICKKYLAEKIKKDTENYILWKCKFCGFERFHKRAWVIWKMNKDKFLLKRNGMKRFEEFELKQLKKGFKLIPKEKTLTLI